MAARLRVEQFKIGAFARQGGGQRQIVGFKEIVAAGDDEQGWKIDVERQTLSGEELTESIQSASETLRGAELSMQNMQDAMDNYTITSPILSLIHI